MFYLIEYDTRTVKCVSEDKDAIEAVLNADDALAMCIIGSEDDLSFDLSVNELNELNLNITGDDTIFTNENKLARIVWLNLEHNKCKFSVAELRANDVVLIHSDSPTKEADAETKKTNTKPRKARGIRSKDLIGMTLSNTDKAPRKGSAFALIYNFIDDNIGTASLDEIVNHFIDTYEPKTSKAVIDEKFATGYVRGAFNDGYIEEYL